MSGMEQRGVRPNVARPACRIVKAGGLLLLCAALAGGSAPGWGASEPGASNSGAPGAPSAQVFSSLCTAPGDNDISGLRIRITGAPPDVTVSFEETEGALMVATETREATFAPDTGALAFTVRTEAGAIAFRGRVAATLLTGTLTREGGGPEEIRVPSDRGGDGEGPCSPAGAPVKP